MSKKKPERWTVDKQTISTSEGKAYVVRNGKTIIATVYNKHLAEMIARTPVLFDAFELSVNGLGVLDKTLTDLSDQIHTVWFDGKKKPSKKGKK